MNMFSALTDYNWYSLLKTQNFQTVNFWKPSVRSIRVISEGEIILFKLKKPYYSIVGGGIFSGYKQMTIEEAWEKYGLANGVRSQFEFLDRIMTFKSNNLSIEPSSRIGCILVNTPVFFDIEHAIKPPSDWSKNIVSGKCYNSNYGEGSRLYREFMKQYEILHTGK